MVVDIKRMSEAEGIAEVDVERALSAKEAPSIATSQDARSAFRDAPWWSGKRWRVLRLWKRLSAKEIAEAKTFEQIVFAYVKAPVLSRERAMALKQLQKLFARKIACIATFEQARELYCSVCTGVLRRERWQAGVIALSLATTPGQVETFYECAPHGSRESRSAVKKLRIFAAQATASATTFAEAINAYGIAPRGSKEQLLACVKALSFCNTLDLSRKAFEFIMDNAARRLVLKHWLSLCTVPQEARYVHTFMCRIGYSDGKELTMERWRHLSFEAIVKVVTFEDAERAYLDAPPGDLQSAALEKLIALCDTPARARQAHNSSLCTGRGLIMKKWNGLSLQEIAQAKTLEQAREALQNAPEYSESRTQAIAKIAMFYEK